MDRAEAEARTIGASSVCLHTRREALGVRKLYEKRGFRRYPAGDLDRLPEVFLVAFELQISG
jgi:hypothetical protein